MKRPPSLRNTTAPDVGAIVHTTMCHRYVVDLRDDRVRPTVCRSLQQVYDLLQARAIRQAVLAQRTSYDEMVGQPASEGVSFLPLPVPRG